MNGKERSFPRYGFLQNPHGGHSLCQLIKFCDICDKCCEDSLHIRGTREWQGFPEPSPFSRASILQGSPIVLDGVGDLSVELLLPGHDLTHLSPSGGAESILVRTLAWLVRQLLDCNIQ